MTVVAGHPSAERHRSAASTAGRPTTGLMLRALAFLVAFAAVLVVAPASSSADAPRPRLAVAGGTLVDSSSGSPIPIQLRGVNRSGTEYACAADVGGAMRGYAVFDGPTYQSANDVRQPDASLQAMQRWGINAVRVPLSDACWFGNGALDPAYSSTRYQNAIVDYVDQLGRHGMTAILSLHVASTTATANLGLRLLPMPDAERGPAFWASVVERLGHALPSEGGLPTQRRNVVLDLFNEPHLEDVPEAARWTCWRDGCRVNQADEPQPPDPITGEPAPDPTPAYDTAGMTDLVEAVRRKERDGAPTRPLMLGGLDYANDLSGWKAHLPSDPGDRLVASFHLYGGGDGTAPYVPDRPDGGGGLRPGTPCNDVACWGSTIGAIAGEGGGTGRPVVTGEVGQYDCRSRFVRRYATWADDHGVSYLAWTWNATYAGTAAAPGPRKSWACDGNPALIRHHDGTPTDAYGLGWCQQLRARATAVGAALPSGENPCPASRLPSEPPADRTPPPPPVTDPGPTVPAPTDPVPTAPDPGASAEPFPAPVTVPLPSAPPTPAQPPTAPPTSAGEPRTARVTSSSLRLRKGKVTVVVSCAKASTPCAGAVKIRTSTRVALGRRRAVLVLVRAPYRLKAGATARLRVAPTKDGRALLRRTRRIKAVATSTSMGALPSTRRLTLSR